MSEPREISCSRCGEPWIVVDSLSPWELKEAAEERFGGHAEIESFEIPNVCPRCSDQAP